MNLHYKVFGEGEPVVILHGFLGMLDNWQTFAKALAEHYMVFIIDQRDHGKSPHTDIFNYQVLAEDLHQFLSDQWIYKAKFIGHSMGGKTVLTLANLYPDLVEKMVIVDIGIKSYKGGHESILNALNALTLNEVENRGDADQALAKSISSWGIRQFLLKNLTRRKGGGYQFKMNLPLLTEAYPNILKGIAINSPIEIPTMFIRGGESQYIEEKDFDELSVKFENLTIETIEGAGHWVHAEKPQETLDLTKAFF